jgi:hypothetical protein
MPITITLTPTETVPTISGFQRPTDPASFDEYNPPTDNGNTGSDSYALASQDTDMLDSSDASLPELVFREDNALHQRVIYPGEVVCVDIITSSLVFTRTITGASTVTILGSGPTQTVYQTDPLASTVVPPEASAVITFTIVQPSVATSTIIETIEWS